MEVAGDFDKDHCVAVMGVAKALLGEHSTEKVGEGRYSIARRDAFQGFARKGLSLGGQGVKRNFSKWET